jgi:hypothetical protein
MAWHGLVAHGEDRGGAPVVAHGGSGWNPVNRQRGEVGNLTRSKLASSGARFLGQKWESSSESGCSRRRRSGGQARRRQRGPQVDGSCWWAVEGRCVGGDLMGWWLGWKKTRGSGACGGARGSSGGGEPSVTGRRRGRWCRLTGRRATRWLAWGAASRSAEERWWTRRQHNARWQA